MARQKRFEGNGEGIREITRMAGVQAEVEAKAERIAATARSIAPYDTTKKDGVHYRDSISVQSLSSTQAGWTQIYDRPIKRVIAEVPYAAAVEVNHRVLGRSADA